MTAKKKLQIRNSTAEFLIFTNQAKEDGIEVRVQDETIWLSQKLMGILFACSTDNISLHLKNIFKENELDENSVTENFSVTASDGKVYKTKHYNLDAIISVGYRIMCIILTTLCLSGCEKDDSTYADENEKDKLVYENEGEKYIPLNSAETLKSKLEGIYAVKSTDSLKLFVEEWNKNVKPNSAEYIASAPEIQAVYDVYRVFFNPLEDSTYTFGVVPNIMSFSVGSTDSVMTISDFRPPVTFDDSKVLYLTDEYLETLNYFLSINAETQHITTEPLPEEIDNRADFLRTYISVIPGHWGHYFSFYTPYVVRMIRLDKSLKHAKVEFQHVFTGGHALMDFEDSEWKIKEFKTTWAE